MKTKLLLVDDHPLFRRGVRELVVAHCQLYDDVLEADNGHDALQLVERFAVACVMLDIAMPGIDGLATLDIMKLQYPTIKCIILSMYNKPEFVTEARKRGADGYILKTDSDEVILDCLQRVHEGVYYVSSTIQDGADPQLPDLDAEAVNLQCLSKREGEVLALIAKNCTSKEISQQLRLSLRTVQNHRVNICKKLKISGPNALLKIAIENQAKL